MVRNEDVGDGLSVKDEIFRNIGTKTILLFWELEGKDTRCIYVF